MCRGVLSKGGAEVFQAASLAGHVSEQHVRLYGRPLTFVDEDGNKLEKKQKTSPRKEEPSPVSKRPKAS